MPKGLKPVAENLDYIVKDNDFANFSSLQKIGEIEFKDASDLLVFACKYKGELSNRSSKKKQFEIAKKVLKEDFKDGAIFVFYDANNCFRFSFIRKNYGNKDQRFSNWKRYTYFVDPKATNKTFKSRFKDFNFGSLDEIQDAFNVEKLTKQFYNELFAWYQWAYADKDGFEVTFPNDISTDTDDRQIEEHLIRLITRLMFVWFIKKKNLIPNEIFNLEFLKNNLVDFDPTSKSNGDYYNAILQNLFFASLNKPIDERIFATDKSHHGKDEHYGIKTLFRDNKTQSWFTISQTEIIDLYKSVPFLNGGLFECLDKENDNGKIFYYDGFSRLEGSQKRAFLPNCIFFDPEKGIIPLLERYNFTIEENAIDDVEVALDPELLGKVFENLLGAYNPETKETARKQSGSFYTPREIVDYMVNESILQYLQKECPKIEEPVLQKLFSEDNLPQELSLTDCIKIATSLRNIKILDPACGSGAFPMGVLNTLYKIIKKTDTKNAFSSYAIKLELIENCIYGVDIQSIAVQISKLRFFIALVVEQETTNDVKDNYGIKSLPNLETKFVAANTLIGLKPEAKNILELQDDTLLKLKTALWDVRCRQNFRAQKWQEKKALREQDKKLCLDIEMYLHSIAPSVNEILIAEHQKQIAKQEAEIAALPEVWADALDTKQQVVLFETSKKVETIFKIDVNKTKRDQLIKSNKELAKKITSETSKQNVTDTSDADKLIQWDPYNQNTYSKFFDPEWMFGVAQFDVVIGNPPYIQLQKLPNSEVLATLSFETYSKSTDLYCLFYEMGIKFLKVKGNLCYITSNSWLRTKYGQSLRKFFAEKSNPIQLINFEDIQIFQSAVVESNILITEKAVFTGNLKAANVGSDLDNNLTEYVANKNVILKELDNNGWILGNLETLNLKKKIECNSVLLGNMNYKIMSGVKTGFNEAYLLNENKKNELISIDKRNEKIIKPVIRGRDLRKYKFMFDNVYLINAHNGLKSKNIKHIDIEKDYNSVFEHFKNYKSSMEFRPSKGLHWTNTPATFSDEYDKPKIIWGELSDIAKFTYDETGLYVEATVFLMTGDNLKFILSIFNSKLAQWYFEQIATSSGMGTNRWKKYKIEQFPIKETNEVAMQKFEVIVNQILSNKKDNIDTTDLETKIDLMVYKLYELTYDEVLVVEPGFKNQMGEQDYDNFAL